MSVKNRTIDEEILASDATAMDQEMRADMVKWINKYGFAMLGPFLIGVGVSMVEQAVGPPAALEMLQEIVKQEQKDALH